MVITQKPSPNFSIRNGQKPELIVIHIMAGSLKGTDSWFANPVSKVSAHYGVGFHGEIHQYVQEKNKAWHAGGVNAPNFKLFKNGVNPNEYTIGIECEGYDLKDAPQAQLTALAALVADICTRNSILIDRDHIIGHYQINSVSRPNCPSTDKTVLDKIVSMADPIVQVPVSRSKVEKVLTYLKSLL